MTIEKYKKQLEMFKKQLEENLKYAKIKRDQTREGNNPCDVSDDFYDGKVKGLYSALYDMRHAGLITSFDDGDDCDYDDDIW